MKVTTHFYKISQVTTCLYRTTLRKDKNKSSPDLELDPFMDSEGKFTDFYGPDKMHRPVK